jgi:hypothetical protein
MPYLRHSPHDYSLWTGYATSDSKSGGSDTVGVRFPLPAQGLSSLFGVSRGTGARKLGED